MLNQNDFLGEFAVTKCEQRAAEKGWICNFPKIPTRYDVIFLTDNNQLLKAQIKYCDRKKHYGSLSVSLDNRGKRYLRKEIDVLLVYLACIDRVVSLPPKLFHGKSAIVIRFKASKRYKKTRAVLAQDYWF